MEALGRVALTRSAVPCSAGAGVRRLGSAVDMHRTPTVSSLGLVNDELESIGKETVLPDTGLLKNLRNISNILGMTVVGIRAGDSPPLGQPR
jgi:hypothetical protein